MRYLIINIYDSWFGRSICVNGEVYTEGDLIDDLYRLYYGDTKYQDLNSFEKLVVEKYGDQFDLIVICEDGDTTVVKGENHV